MMNGFGNYGYGMGLGWIFMVLFWGILIYLAISLFKKSGSGANESAQEILRKRYARGEISREEFERIKKEITT